MTAAARFAEWALALRPPDVPSDVRAAATRHLLDGLGTAVAAARLGEASAAVETAARLGGTGEATVIGDGRRLTAPAAALANGALVHALDFDDTHQEALVHATAAVLPAAFAVAEETGAAGAEMLTAAVAGYETVIRLGAAVPHAFHERGFHATSVCGVFASALVAARLMGLDRAAAVNALGVAGSLASGSLEFLHTGSATKQLHPGLSGMGGVIAARLAAAGAEGPASIIEGAYGLFRSFADADVDPAALTKDLGEAWETLRITIKPYPACQLSHASLDALRAARVEDPASVEEIVFEIPPGSVPIVSEPAESKRAPRTPYDGKFSLPYCAAALLLDGNLGIDSFEAARLARPDVLALAARVGYRESGFAGAPADAPGAVEVRLRDGRVLRGKVPCSRGGPGAPLADEELHAKLAGNAGEQRARALAALARDLDALPSVGPLLQATL